MPVFSFTPLSSNRADERSADDFLSHKSCQLPRQPSQTAHFWHYLSVLHQPFCNSRAFRT